MGTPEFSVPALDALVAAGHQVVCVYSQPPRPAGRGKKERLTPVHSRALALGLPVRTPLGLKTSTEQKAFADLQAEVAVVVAYGLILPQAILDAPRHGCLNIHASLLPRWRGAAPIHRAILQGDPETGVCIMQMDSGLDTGPVLLCDKTAIGPDDTTGSLHDRLSTMGAMSIARALDHLPAMTPCPQSTDGVSYAAKIDKSEAPVDWTQPAVQIDRQIRGLSPSPGAWTTIRGERVKLLASRPVDGQGAAGCILDDAMTVACGTGAVQITRLQRAGKGAQQATEVLRGWTLAAGDRMGT